MNVLSWLQQPTTITGIGALVGTLAGTAAQVVTGDATVSAGAGAAAFAVVHLLINDNTVAGDAQKLTSDALTSPPSPVAIARDAVTLAIDGVTDLK